MFDIAARSALDPSATHLRRASTFDGQACWQSKRNCSAGPRQLAGVMASVAFVSLIFGAAFALHGLWLVLPFVGIEWIALAAAFVVYGRHATDCERIELVDGAVQVEHVDGARTRRWRLVAAWTRVESDLSDVDRAAAERGRPRIAGLAAQRRARIELCCGSERVEVGRLLSPARRAQLAEQLRRALRTAA